ncbi:MAG: glutamate racemase [Deinococcaceae bacterium]
MLTQALQLSSQLSEPIGVFDSGVGGLTVLKALRTHLPNQDFIYLGDTARIPYGRKPQEMVANFAYEITRFLEACGVAGVVIACNTASAAALPELQAETHLPIWGVIDPGVTAARRVTQTGHVGVIGTQGTIANGAYQKRLRDLGLTVWAQACPLFVPLVEEGLVQTESARVLAQHYLAERPSLDTLILGCTHYPLLKKTLAEILGPGVHLVDSAEVTAETVREQWGHSGRGQGKVVHFVTGDPLAFHHTAGIMGEIGAHSQTTWLEVSVLTRFQRPSVFFQK